MKKIIRAFLPCIFLFIETGCTGQPGVSMPREDSVVSLMKQYHVPAVAIGIIENGMVKETRVFGNITHHSPAPYNTIFNIASLTKPLVSTTVLMLVSQDKWDLDKPLYHYWTDPDVSEDPRHKKLTTRHVLSHQSGLPNWRGHEPGGKLSFAFEPGTEWKYSGEGFEYLRQALERHFKLPIEKLADSLVFKPYGMNDTRFYWDQGMDSLRYANRHRRDGSAYEMETWNAANASNLVLTTIHDYTKFGVQAMKGTHLKPAVYKEMTSKQVQLKNNKEFGLGWVLIKDLTNGEHAIMHTGSNPGINTIIILLPASKRGIVVFTNGDNGYELYEKLIEQSFDLGKEVINRMK